MQRICKASWSLTSTSREDEEVSAPTSYEWGRYLYHDEVFTSFGDNGYREIFIENEEDEKSFARVKKIRDAASEARRAEFEEYKKTSKASIEADRQVSIEMKNKGYLLREFPTGRYGREARFDPFYRTWFLREIWEGRWVKEK